MLRYTLSPVFLDYLTRPEKKKKEREKKVSKRKTELDFTAVPVDFCESY